MSFSRSGQPPRRPPDDGRGDAIPPPPDDGGESAASPAPDDGGGGGASGARITLGLVVLAALAIVYLLATTGSTTASGGSTPPDPQIEALGRLGIPPARASQAIAVQSEVANTELINKVQAALGNDEFAGVWFEPTVAKFYVGVTSAASRQKVEQVVAKAKMTSDTVITSVRSTWAELIDAQEQWNQRLARLRASAQAATGIFTPRNAVLVELSSSLDSAERAILEKEAAAAGVNIVVSVVPPSRLHGELLAKKTCRAKYIKYEAYCEEAITSGVSLYFGAENEPDCTSGPMLITGTETFMLTAGHCFDQSSPSGGSGVTVNRAVQSKYTSGGPKEIGNEVLTFWNNERDVAAVKVKLPPGGGFSEALPVPVPALMAEWGTANPATPHAVNGVQVSETVATGQIICHEGMTSGEHCGQIKALNITSGAAPFTEHLVETTACGERGDSGGPYFFRTGTGEILMMGTLVSGGPLCNEQGSPRTAFEPLIGLQGAVEKYGILNTFGGKSLLTTTNERRCP
jgi:hypothetical protein